MKSKFDSWNEQKKSIELLQEHKDRYPNEREVWMCSFGINIGYEQNGGGKSFSRPVVIIKKINNHMFLCVPLSTKQKDFDFYFNYTDEHKQEVSAILCQIRLLSIKRMKRKMYQMDNQTFASMCLSIKSFF